MPILAAHRTVLVLRNTTQQGVSVCHSLAVFSRYLVCDADDGPRRRSRTPRGFSYSALALPNLGQGLATVVAHGLVGSALGLYAWNFVAARSGEVGMDGYELLLVYVEAKQEEGGGCGGGGRVPVRLAACLFQA